MLKKWEFHNAGSVFFRLFEKRSRITISKAHRIIR